MHYVTLNKFLNVLEILFPQASVEIIIKNISQGGFPGGSAVKNLPAMQKMQETQVPSLDREDPLEGGMATHSSILAWKMSWTEATGGLQSIGLQRVRHN